jgi:hypothetical protein
MNPVVVSDLKIAELGSVRFARSARAKYQRITVRQDRTITVTIPRRGSVVEAREFLQSKIPWVQKQLRKIDHHAEAIRPVDVNIDLEKAQDELFERLNEFSRQYDLPYNRAAFRCQKTKWGSCSSRNNISLNINIAYLPRHLQDYLLMHELVHTKIRNHSKRYWSELDKYTNHQAKALTKELKKHRMTIKA